MDIEEAKTKLDALDQRHLLEYWGLLTGAERRFLLAQISRVDPSLFALQRQLLSDLKSAGEYPKCTPLDRVAEGDSIEDRRLGLSFLEQGKGGCLVVAGGQGTRLGYEGPKGAFPLTAVKNKSLFQLIAEKTLAAGRQAGRPLPLAVMTSPDNHKATVAYFEDNRRFGLSAGQLSIFVQGQLPLLDRKGDLFLEDKGSIAFGPDGNGNALSHFVESGTWQLWRERGVEAFNFVLVDNPLADPFDAELFGHRSRASVDVAVKTILREDPEEKVGILVKEGEKVRVVEYTEVSSSERSAISEGVLKHRYANIGLYCFSMDFALSASDPGNSTLPLHPALKAVRYLAADGESVKAEKPIAWKFETYIFDLLPRAVVSCLVSPRSSCFAPLKDKESIAAVVAALVERDKRAWSAIAGEDPPSGDFELSPAFYYPSKEQASRWHSGERPKDYYIES